VVLAFAGGRGLERMLELVPRGGRIVFPNGVEPEPERRPGVRIRSYDAEGGAEAFSKLARAAEQAKLEVPIAAAFPLARAADAHRRVTKPHVLGRVVLAIRR
jgi:NADPH:quinone reductase-like Zn-dependent oxidoreductase